MRQLISGDMWGTIGMTPAILKYVVFVTTSPGLP